MSTESSAAITSTDDGIAVESNESSDGKHPKDTATIGSNTNFSAADVTSSFEQMKECYKKIGDNESQALAVWQQLSDDERTSAFAHVQRLQGDLSSRSYLYVYQRDKEWTKATSPVN
jgi:hypothetical protein